MNLIRKKIVSESSDRQISNLRRLEELALLLIRMSIQNAILSGKNPATKLVYACIIAAATML